MKKIIIDTDPGIDDAVALAVAINNPNFQVELITTVAGNVDVDKTTKNSLKILEFFNKDIPVAKGCNEPLIKEFEDAVDIHGESGMDGYDFPEPKTKVLDVHAVEVMREVILKSEEKVSLVALAALTNIGLLFKLYPQVKDNIKEIILMGGSLTRGNTNSVAEFNIFVDPHAAHIVFEAGIPIVMIGLDVTRKAIIKEKEVMEIKEFGDLGQMFYSMFKHYRGGSLKTGLMMHDVCVFTYMVKPQLFKTQDMHIEIALDGPAGGATIGDIRNKYHKKANAKVALDLDTEEFQAWLINELKKIS